MTAGRWFLLLMLQFCAAGLSAQGNRLTFNLTTPRNLNICAGSDTARATIINISPGNVTGVTILLTLPPGVLYVPGSVSGTGVSENNISDPNRPIFNGPNLSLAGRFSFRYAVRSNCALLTFLNASNTPAITCRANYLGSFDQATSNPFPANVPSPGFATITNQSFTGNVGDRFVRTYTITNYGKGPLTSVTLRRVNGKDIRTYGVNRSGTYFGRDTVINVLGKSLLQTIGDRDTVLDQNESVTVSDSIEIVGCSAFGTSIELSWGCDGLTCQVVRSNATVIKDTRAPILTGIVQGSINTCYNSPSASAQRLRFFNRGQMSAENVRITLAQSVNTGFSNNMMSRIDTSSIWLRRGWKGARFKAQVDSIIYTNSSSAGYTCLGPLAVGLIRLRIGTMAPGDTIYIDWNMYTCTPDLCNMSYYGIGWQYMATFTDPCKLTQTVNWTWGQVPTWTGLSVTPLVPTDMVDTEKKLFRYSVGSANFFAGTSRARYWAEIIVPPGLTHSRNTSDFFFQNANLTSTWSPDSVRLYGDTVRAFFKGPVPFSLNNGDLMVYLTASCVGATGNSNRTVNATFRYNPDPQCNPSIWIRTFCNSVTLRLHCYDVCNGGMQFRNFKVERSTFGLPDNNNDGIPDATGSLDHSKIRKERALPGDTITSTFFGKVRRTSTVTLWRFAYAESIVTNGSYLTVVDARLRVFKRGSLYSGTCNRVRHRKVTTGLDATFYFDFTLDSIASGGCLPSSYLYTLNDSIELIVRYRVSGNPGVPSYGGVTARWDNRFYFGSVPAPNTSQRFQCDTFSGQMFIGGWYFLNWVGNTYNINSCDPLWVNNYFYLSAGPCCSNYGGGNYFQYEYRNFGRLKAVRLHLPSGTKYIRSQIVQFRTAGSNQTVTEIADSLQPVAGSINPLVIDATNLYKDRGGKLSYSDDGFHGYFNALIQPGCELPSGTPITLKYDFIFERRNSLGRGFDTVPSSVAGHDDYLVFNRPNLSLQPVLPTLYASSDTAEWEVRYSNASPGFAAFNTWLSPVSTGGIRVVEIRDAVRDTIIRPVNGIYRAGNLPGNGVRRFKVRAVYSSCTKDSLTLLGGWNCLEYPKDLTGYRCTPNATKLYLEPQNTRLQLTLFDSASIAPLCAEVPYRILLENVQGTNTFNTRVQVTLPLGMEVVSGSVRLQYPRNSSPVSLPAPVLVSGTTYEWNLDKLNSTLAKGFKGISDTSKNKLLISFRARTNCDYSSGSFVRANAAAIIRCGDPVPSIPAISYPLDIKGVVRPYFTQVKQWADSIFPCEKPSGMRVRIIVLGPDSTSRNDKYQLMLPKGMVYDTSSLVSLRNGPTAVRGRDVNGATEIEWSLRGGLLPGDSMEFRFRINTDGRFFSCGQADLYGQSVVKQEVVCVKDNSKCTINVITGKELSRPVLLKAQPQFSNAGITSRQISNDSEEIKLTYTIRNTGVRLATGVPVIVRYHYDANASAGLNAGDPLLGTDTLRGGLAANGSLNISRTLRIRAGYSCAVIAVVDSAACACLFRQTRFPVPALSNAGPDLQVCSGDSLRAGLFNTRQFSYSWEPAAAFDNDTLARPRVLLLNGSGISETYDLMLTTRRGLCTSRDTVRLVVHPLPLVAAGPADTLLCVNQPANLKATARGGNGPYRYRWYPASGIADSTQAQTTARPAATTTYRMEVRDKNNCKAYDTARIQIRQYPKAHFSWSRVCEGKDPLISDSSTLSSGSIQERQWQLGSLDTLNGLTHTLRMNGNLSRTVRLVAIGDAKCTDTFQQIVSVYPGPRAAFGNRAACFGKGADTLRFTDSTTLLNGTLRKPHWDFGDGMHDSGTLVKHVYAAAGSYTVTLIAKSMNGCEDTFSGTATVHPRPVAALRSNGVCIGDSLRFSDNTNWNGASIGRIDWKISASNIYSGNSAAWKSTTTGLLPVALKVESDRGCADSRTDSFRIYPLPVPLFGALPVCEDSTTRFRDSSSISFGSIRSRSWVFGDGNASALNNPTHRYNAGGRYTVTLQLESNQGCRDSITKEAVVYAAVRPGISLSDHCFREDAVLGGSNTGSGTPKAWKWFFGNGDSSFLQNPIHKYRNPGLYNLRLSLSNTEGCLYHTSRNLRVHALPKVGFGAVNACYDNRFQFNDTLWINGGSIASQRWDFGDGQGSNSGSPVHAYPGAGAYRVALIAVSNQGCQDSLIRFVTAYDRVIPAFSADTVCLGGFTSFNDLSTVPGGSVSRHAWTFGDGRSSSAANPQYTYRTDGFFNVRLGILTNFGCRYDTVQPIWVYPVPTAGFDIQPADGTTILDPVIRLLDRSSGATQYWYDMGDGSSLYLTSNVNHTYADSGWYRLRQWVQNDYGCRDSSEEKMQVRYVFTLHVPTAFTPGRDGKNDLFAPQGMGIRSYKMEIYSRWGELMYRTNNSEPWDGTFKGLPVTPGVYVVSLDVTDFQGVRHWYNNTFHLIR
jgi:gliding motility-associated-like protein